MLNLAYLNAVIDSNAGHVNALKSKKRALQAAYERNLQALNNSIASYTGKTHQACLEFFSKHLGVSTVAKSIVECLKNPLCRIDYIGISSSFAKQDEYLQHEEDDELCLYSIIRGHCISIVILFKQ